MKGAAGEPESVLESKEKALQLGMLPVTLQASMGIAGITGGQSNGSSTGGIDSECEQLIEEIASSINDKQISQAFTSAAVAKLAG